MAVGALLLSVVVAAGAYPEGAPWGAANPAADQSCDSCHYDYDPVRDSAALTLVGLPAAAEAGREYELVVRFEQPEAASSGFQLITGTGGESDGEFRAVADAIEAIGAAARSTATRLRDDGFEWQLWWRAPDDAQALTVFLAASSANDDQSPFGDTIHYRQYDVLVQGMEGSGE